MRMHHSLIVIVCMASLQACVTEAVEDEVDDLIGTAADELVVTNTLPASGTKTVSAAVYPGLPTYVVMSSPSSGTWKFSTSGSPISLGDCASFVVYTYWRDTSVSSMKP